MLESSLVPSWPPNLVSHNRGFATLFSGTGVTYTVLADNKTLMQSKVKAGILPHNLSLDATAQQLIGPGVHHLDIVASSNTTESEITESLTVHLVEPISNLQATLASHAVELGEELEIMVSVPHGAPERLRFELVGLNETFSHMKDGPKEDTKAYRIPVKSEGTVVQSI